MCVVSCKTCRTAKWAEQNRTKKPQHAEAFCVSPRSVLTSIGFNVLSPCCGFWSHQLSHSVAPALDQDRINSERSVLLSIARLSELLGQTTPRDGNNNNNSPDTSRKYYLQHCKLPETVEKTIKFNNHTPTNTGLEYSRF